MQCQLWPQSGWTLEEPEKAAAAWNHADFCPSDTHYLLSFISIYWASRTHLTLSSLLEFSFYRMTGKRSAIKQVPRMNETYKGFFFSSLVNACMHSAGIVILCVCVCVCVCLVYVKMASKIAFAGTILQDDSTLRKAVVCLYLMCDWYCCWCCCCCW